MREYDEANTFYLVDIKDIKSNVNRSSFDEKKLEQLADSILESGCLLKPLILSQTGPMSYEVIAGHFEYWAAVRANEKDIKRSLKGMVSSFLVREEAKKSASEQANILNETVSGSLSFDSIPSDTNLEKRLNKLEKQQKQDVQRLEEQIRQLQSQMDKPATVESIKITSEAQKLELFKKIANAEIGDIISA